MASQAVSLDDKDVADIAAYIASLPGPLVQKK
jgi:cytochrome c553